MKLSIKKYQSYFIQLFLFLSSFASFLYFYLNHKQNLLYGDALSRLNISRKVIDNLTPGIVQLGNVWLPLPQIVMTPFTWNTFLWHTGIAGAIISMSAFILGGIFLYKTVEALHNNFFASLFSVLIYAVNINLLYLQTTAMSEPIFLCSLLAGVYFFTLWIKTNNNMLLIPAGIAVAAMTLIRYESFAFLFASIPTVYLYVFYKSKKNKYAESATILYGVVALLGFGLWSLYLQVVFGDPLFWLHFYAGGSAPTKVTAIVHQITYLDAFWHYFTAVVWMNGIIPTFLALIAIPIFIYTSLKTKTFYFIPLLLLGMLFIFMVLTIHKNTPIHEPVLNITNILSTSTANYLEFNIRYGLIMLPLIAILCSYVAISKKIVINVFLVLLLISQVANYFRPVYTPIYPIPVSISKNITQSTPQEKTMVAWLKAHYDHGLILISALKHDPELLELGFDYKTYIHEGTGKYWQTSIKDPTQYARWVVFDAYNPEDQVTKYLYSSKILQNNYFLVYNKDGIRIYKIKGEVQHPLSS